MHYNLIVINASKLVRARVELGAGVCDFFSESERNRSVIFLTKTGTGVPF